ncbi:MAG: GDP-mannose 4,6-dehydratase, partial [Chloroflexota bacterium]|nr:GDP-mannose 4,6-dehydratase [Chloroflexota bacterium]
VRILVAGGAGFIGSHLTDALLARGDEVIVWDNLITGTMANLAHLGEAPGFTFVRHDIVQPLPDPGPIERIYHLASPASPEGYRGHPIETHLTNSLGTYHLLELAKATGARLLLASTSEAYGDPQEHPQRETYRGYVNPVGPRSCYDESKRFAESLTMEYHRIYDQDTRIVRIFNTYGPRMDIADGRVIPNLLSQALRGEALTLYDGGERTRAFCYIADLVRGLTAVMESPNAKGEVINLGNPDERTIRSLAEAILRATNRTLPFVDRPTAVGDDPNRRCPDIAKARALVGWEPAIPLDEGLRLTIPFFEQVLGNEGLRAPSGQHEA